MPQIQGLGPKENTLYEMFFNRAKQQPDSAFIWTKKENEWKSHSWGHVANQVKIIASALTQRGITAGARVAILSENRLEWIITDLAIMSIGAISVPLFTTYTWVSIPPECLLKILITVFKMEVTIRCSTSSEDDSLLLKPDDLPKGVSDENAIAFRVTLQLDKKRKEYSYVDKAESAAILSDNDGKSIAY